jgi:hypothetical protein
MDHEFQINRRLRGMENETLDKRDERKDDRLDQRERIKAEAKNQGESLKKFESSGNDVVGGGLGLERFNPR